MTNEELVFLYRGGDQSALNELYSQNKGLIMSVVSHLSGSRRTGTFDDPASTSAELLREDLAQDAFFSLVKAADAFDPDQGASFSTYLSRALCVDLRKVMMETTGTVRIPVNCKSLMWRYDRYVEEYVADKGKAPSSEEAAAALGVSVSDIRRIVDRRQLRDVASLDAPIGDDGDGSLSLLDVQSDGECFSDAIIDRMEKESLRGVIWPLVDDLSQRQANAIRLRYQEGLTYQQIAERTGGRLQNAKQAHDEGIRKLRKDEVREKLLPYLDGLAAAEGMKHTGLSSFRQTGSSSVERAAIKLEEMRNRILRHMDELREEMNR